MIGGQDAGVGLVPPRSDIPDTFMKISFFFVIKTFALFKLAVTFLKLRTLTLN
jgi:hypothetical protein